MITIEHLEVLFDAERQRDEIRFAELFERHIGRHESRRTTDEQAEAQAAAERSIAPGRAGW